MSRLHAGSGAALLLLLPLLGPTTTGCEAERVPEGSHGVQAQLEAGVVARVAGDPIASATVERIAAAQGLELTAARDRAVFDALFAAEARARELDRGRSFDARVALARATLDDVVTEALAEGPPTDDELARWTARLYYSLDRPESVRTVHAVVRVAEGADEATWASAEAVAARLRQQVEPAAELARQSEPSLSPGAPDPAEERFLELARATSSQSLELVAEALPPVAADGYTVQPEGRAPFDPAFVRVATSLRRRGDLSAPFRSSFGVHVVLHLQVVAAARVPLEERRRLLGPDIHDERVRLRRSELVARLRKEVPVEIERGADALLERAIAR